MRSYHRRFLFFLILGLACLVITVLMKVYHYGYGFVTAEGFFVVGVLLLLNAFFVRKKDQPKT